jgi:outer membrane protein assembly factor BamB
MKPTLVASLAVLPLTAAEPVAFWKAVTEPVSVPAAAVFAFDRGDFSLSLWLQADAGTGGDLVSRYDPAKRRGFHLTLKSNPGVTSNQANWRHLQFGIDDHRDSAWTACGRPGRALFAFALAVHEGALYAGTCEPGKDERGRVYRFDGDDRWIHCGAPDGANSVTALAVVDGALYAGTGKYRVAGSSLPESENTTPGGKVFRYGGGEQWIDCGQLPGTEAVGGLVVHEGKLHASSLYRPAGFFRYEGGTKWTILPVPRGPDLTTKETVAKRVVPLTVHGGSVYAGSYDGGHVYRFDGTDWTDCGRLGENTQTYAFASVGGSLAVGTWPSGRVYRFDGIDRWSDLGRLGEELEVMGMLVHNGRFLAGTLPLAEVHESEGGTAWKRLARLDPTPDVKYRRAWTMAEHDGRIYVSTLPSGVVHSFAAGTQVQWGHSLSEAWHHVAAVKTGQALVLYLDGREIARRDADLSDYDLSNEAPLTIAAGRNGPLRGRLREVRVWRGALSEEAIGELAKATPQ